MQRPEVLAPAGSGVALRAAVRAGADAVYFGLERFSARQRAENLAIAALGGWLGELHEQGVKGYLALNTLVFDQELGELGRVMGVAAEAGVDAVIVQELGAFELVRAMAPSVAVHVSTQATVVSARELALWQRLGARRVVLARELDYDELARLRESTSLELEVFVHGALCLSYSGQCLASAAFGGRSANRGECAQPCRLPYRLGGRGVAEHPLSPCDLRASSWVGRLGDLGIDALKIEGRLKGPEYVAAAVRLYRMAVDAWRRGEPADLGPAERATEQSFSRGAVVGWLGGVDYLSLVDGGAGTHRGVLVGAAEGIDHVGRRRWIRVRLGDEVRKGDGLHVGNCSGRVWAIRRRRGREWSDVGCATADDEVRIWLGPEAGLAPFAAGASVHKTDDPRLGAELRRPERHRLRLALRLRRGSGGEVWLEGESEDGRRATVPVAGGLGAAPRAADSRWYAEKLGRLGDTPFVLGELVVELPPALSPPASALNRARRALVRVFAAEARRGHPVHPVSAETLLGEAARPAPLPPGLYVLVRRPDQVEPALAAGADGIYLDCDEELAEATEACRRRGALVGRVTPRIDLASPPDDDADLWLVRTLGSLGTTRAPAVADATLHAANRLSVTELLELGARAVTPAFEVDQRVLETWLGSGLGPYLELVCYQHVPLFVTRHCLYAAQLARARDPSECGRACQAGTLRLTDRRRAEHSVLADQHCISTIYEGQPRELRTRLAGIGRCRVELLDEPPEAVRRLVERLRTT